VILFCEGDEGGVGHGFDEAVAENAERDAAGAGVIADGGVRLSVGADGTLIDERTIGDDVTVGEHGGCGGESGGAAVGVAATAKIVEIIVAGMFSARSMAGAQDLRLGTAADSHILMALGAGHSVVHGAKAFFGSVNFGEDAGGGVHVGLGHRAVGLTVKSGGGFGNGLSAHVHADSGECKCSKNC
jgi:hypothetical protein